MPRKRKIEKIETKPEPEPELDKIKEKLNEIKNKPGIVGYIIRNKRSATIDLDDPTKLIDYAILSTSAKETAKQLSKIFTLDETKYTIIEGEKTKLLNFSINENDISIFAEKQVNLEKIYKDLT